MSVTIHPFKGYLNTRFHIYLTGEEQNYFVFKKDDVNSSPIISGKVYPNTPYDFCIPLAGDFSVKFDDEKIIDIHIEDGYKFGGSRHKKSFIFDACPWCFIIMYDRTYFYNRDTKKSYVEQISPDKITMISEKYVLLENNNQCECTIYSLNQERPILSISNIIAFNENITKVSHPCY